MNKKRVSILFALLAAALYAANIPVSKILLTHIEPVYMAAFLYFGAGIGMAIIKTASRKQNEQKLTKSELPYIIGMIVLDIVAPICLMLGLKSASSANVSLLNNLEIVATALIAFALFKEKISGLMWVAIGCITSASMLLSFVGIDSLHFSYGSLFVLAACLCWGLENNCTRELSDKSAIQIVLLKGVFSGLGSFIIALISRESFPEIKYIAIVLALGFVSYGLSILFYVKAQKELGAAKTSAYYAVNPFIGSILALALFREPLSRTYPYAIVIMLIGACFAIADTLLIKHSHMHSHNGVSHIHIHRHFLSEEKHEHH